MTSYLEKLGIKEAPAQLHVYAIVREDMRVLFKHLNANYLFWLDADIKPPRVILSRLIHIIEGPTKADLACGWYLDRHTQNPEPDIYTLESIEPDSQEDPLMGYRCSGHQLRAMKAPVAIKAGGFGCVMLTKQLNDRISFFRQEFITEDLNFCLNAHQRSYRMYVDPSCYCAHQA